MTILCGVFSTGNKAEIRPDFDLMMVALDDELSDSRGTWRGDFAALGQVTVNITPESLKENLPLHRSLNDTTIAGNIRLDNRDELFLKLNIPSHAQKDYGDGRMVLLAYEKWGELCPEHLMGDFSFAIWDGVNQRLFCCVDHFANRSLYYFHDGKKFIFASTPNPILAIKEVSAGINYNKLSTLVFKDAKHLFWNESWFEHISLIPACTSLTVTAAGIRKRKYWTPQTGSELSFKNEEEYREAFQQVFFRAVGDRLRSSSPVSALLSGGLDSSAIVGVAAKILEKQNKELQVFSAVLPDENDKILTDERYYIDQFRSFSNVNINYIVAPGKGFFSDIDALQTNIYAPNLIPSHYLHTAFVEKARSLGSKVIFDGGGGELGASFHGDGGYAEWFCRLRWLHLWREINARKSLLGEPIRHNFTGNVLRPLLPGLVIRSGNSDYTGLGPEKEHCLQPEFAELLRNKLKDRKDDVQSYRGNISASHRKNQLEQILVTQNKSQGSGDFGQVEYRFPLKDIRLLEFCLNLPLNLKIKNGYSRYAVRAGLDGILPAEIQWRTSKNPFSPDYLRRYKAQLPQVRQYLKAIGEHDPIRKIINIDALIARTNIPLADNERNTFAEKTARDFVPAGIYLIQFLRRFKEFQI